MSRAGFLVQMDIRGVYGQELTHDLVIDLCYALGTYFGKGPIVVGYDGRKSHPVLYDFSGLLNSAGLDTANAGLIPLHACSMLKAPRIQDGIMITASHNPPQYNGIKPTAADGLEIPREHEPKVEDVYYSKGFIRIDGTGRDYVD